MSSLFLRSDQTGGSQQSDAKKKCILIARNPSTTKALRALSFDLLFAYSLVVRICSNQTLKDSVVSQYCLNRKKNISVITYIYYIVVVS